MARGRHIAPACIVTIGSGAGMENQVARRETVKLTSTLCPVCGTRCKTLRTEQVTSEVREVTYACRDEANCGHVFVAQIAPIRTIRPSLSSCLTSPTALAVA